MFASVGQIWAQNVSDWPQMRQIRDIFRSDFRTFWLAEHWVNLTYFGSKSHNRRIRPSNKPKCSEIQSKKSLICPPQFGANLTNLSFETTSVIRGFASVMLLTIVESDKSNRPHDTTCGYSARINKTRPSRKLNKSSQVPIDYIRLPYTAFLSTLQISNLTSKLGQIGSKVGQIWDFFKNSSSTF